MIRSEKIMYKPVNKAQSSFLDFNQPLGRHMNLKNWWVKMVDSVPWEYLKKCRTVSEQYGECWKASAAGIGLPDYPDTIPVCWQGVGGAAHGKPVLPVLHRLFKIPAESIVCFQQAGTVSQAHYHGYHHGSEWVHAVWKRQRWQSRAARRRAALW